VTWGEVPGVDEGGRGLGGGCRASRGGRRARRRSWRRRTAGPSPWWEGEGPSGASQTDPQIALRIRGLHIHPFPGRRGRVISSANATGATDSSEGCPRATVGATGRHGGGQTKEISKQPGLFKPSADAGAEQKGFGRWATLNLPNGGVTQARRGPGWVATSSAWCHAVGSTSRRSSTVTATAPAAPTAPFPPAEGARQPDRGPLRQPGPTAWVSNPASLVPTKPATPHQQPLSGGEGAGAGRGRRGGRGRRRREGQPGGGRGQRGRARGLPQGPRTSPTPPLRGGPHTGCARPGAREGGRCMQMAAARGQMQVEK